MSEQVRPPSGYPTSMPPPYAPPQWNANGAPGQPAGPPPGQPAGPPPMMPPAGFRPPGPMPATQPPARWALSIVGFLFSFLFGAIALYFSSQVGTRWQQGDPVGAEKASNMAQIWSIVAIVVGVLALFIIIGSGG